MKNLSRFFAIAILVASSFQSRAQVDFATFLEAGVSDATTIMENYLEPAFLGFGFGINSGWYNTAKPHKLFGFDITPTVSLAMVPTDAEFFTFNASDYSNISLVGTDDQLPTLFGPNLPASQLPLLRYTNGGNSIDVSTPTGLGVTESEDIPGAINAVPSGMVQVGIGLMKNTDLKIRIIPTIESEGEYEFSMFGLGVMHDLKQWVPGLKQLPLDVSGFVGWNRMSTVIVIDDFNTEDTSDDQTAEFATSSFTLQGLVSKQFSILTVFGGVGIATTKTGFDLKGDYDDLDEGIDLPTDPISFDYTSAGPRINLGVRLKLLILTLHADYALQKYNTLTIGAGISIR